MRPNTDGQTLTYESHVVVPAAVSLGLHLPELMRVGADDDAVSTTEPVVAGDQRSIASHQPCQQSLCANNAVAGNDTTTITTTITTTTTTTTSTPV